MDFTSIIGMILGAVLVVVVGIGPGSLGNFWDGASLAIVAGGTLGAVIASYPFQILKEAAFHFKVLFQGKRYDTRRLIDELVEFAQIARAEGLLALEEKASALEDAFLRRGILMVVDGSTAEDVQKALETELESMAQRHDTGAGIYEKAAAYAPAFGMIGTLVGLVNMLKGMDLTTGSTNIGQDMAVALITTFYGCVLANLVFMPIAKKLRIRDEEELLYKEIIIEGVMSIQSGDNPRLLRERLATFLKEKERNKITEDDSRA